MAVKIRLQRRGRKDKPFYRIVIADESAKSNGKVIENIGIFEPKTPPDVKVNAERLAYWQEKGAQPTDAVRKLLL